MDFTFLAENKNKYLLVVCLLSDFLGFVTIQSSLRHYEVCWEVCLFKGKSQVVKHELLKVLRNLNF